MDTTMPLSRYWQTMIRDRRGALTAALLLMGGCAADGGGDMVMTRDTVVMHHGSDVTVQIVESAAELDDVAAWRVDATPAMDIGALDAPQQVALFRVSGAYRLADGRVVVADAGSSEIKVFGSDGELTQTIGRPGEGPGEFRRMSYFGRLPGDSLAVWDLGQARLTVFSPDGTRSRETRIGATPESPRSSVAGVFGDGTLLSRGFVNLGDRVPDGLERHETEVFHLAADGTLLDSIGNVIGGESFFRAVEGGFSFYTPPFGRTTEMIAAGSRLYIADSERPEIRVLTPDGMPVRIVRWAQRPRTISDADIERARDNALESASDDQHPGIERMFADIPMPESMPAFSRVRVDRDGGLWVQLYRTQWDEGMSTWLVFDDEGGLRASIDLPPEFTPTDIGRDWVLGIERNVLDLEFVRLYTLHR
jgi:hypothetical protein